MAEATTNRWNIVAAAIAIQLCLGVIYAWSAFAAYLAKPCIDASGAVIPSQKAVTTGYVPKACGIEGFGWTSSNAQLPFSVGLASFAIVMVLAGRWQDRVGPRTVATVGGILYGIGYVLASYGVPPSPGWLMFSYGVIGGAGIGFAYVCPIATLVKWFPDMRGFISGIAVAGFGAGAFVFSEFIRRTAPSADPGVYSVFLYSGITFLVVVTLAAQFLKNPPQGYKPEGWVPPPAAAKAAVADYGWREMLGTRQFWLLWLMFAIGATAGLMTIGHVKGFSTEVLTKGGYAVKEAGDMALRVTGMLSIFNALGRIAWGAASDRLGRSRAMTLMFLLQACAMYGLTKVSGYYTVMGVACLVGFNFGGNFALFPSATTDYFGTKNVGINYGWVFTSYGVAGIFGPRLGGYVKDTLLVYDKAFLIAGALCVVAALLALVTSAPEARAPAAEPGKRPEAERPQAAKEGDAEAKQAGERPAAEKRPNDEDG